MKNPEWKKFFSSFESVIISVTRVKKSNNKDKMN